MITSIQRHQDIKRLNQGGIDLIEEKFTKKFEPKECSICLEIFRGTLGETTLDCGHTLHTECIYNWIRKEEFKNTCPECRRDISKVNIDKINRVFDAVDSADSRWDCDCVLACRLL